MTSRAHVHVLAVASVAAPVVASVALSSFSHREPSHWAILAAVTLSVGGSKYLLGRLLQSEIWSWAGKIHPQFPPKDFLDSTDFTYLSSNCVITSMFLYHFWLFLTTSPTVLWDPKEITLNNTIPAALLQFAVYDFFYFWFHRALHHRSIYEMVHKHHHRQKSPFRGVFDGINVHPFEMVVGIYIHLLAVYLVPCHIVGAQLFFGLGALMAAFNHTRWGISCPKFYDVRDHDVHHAKFVYNYAQYVMWWDKLFGTYHPPLEPQGTAKSD